MVSKILQHDETTIWFVPATAAQAEDEPFECHNMAKETGVRSAQHDFGTAARSGWYAYRGFCQIGGATPAVGDRVEMRAWTSDGTHPDNDDGTPDASTAVSAIDKLLNLTYIDTIRADQAAQNIEFVKSGRIYLPQRYFAIAFWLVPTTASMILTNDVDENGFTLTPIPMESQ